MNFVDHARQARELQIVGLLEAVCQSLEPTQSQTDLAKQRYEGVGGWLAKSDDPLLRSITIYLQGSTAIGTVVRPIGFNEFDVDLVAHVPDLDVALSPAAQKRAIGDRLKANGNYAALVEEMARCWRLNYAGEFHMDITPSIPNPNCPYGGELVPDKSLKVWKASNPKGYRRMFDGRAKLVPMIRFRKQIAADSLGANVEPYPGTVSFKGILRRIVQIAKRHRDIFFIDNMDVAPLSVIITTLASRSYEWCVRSREYDNELELVLDVIAHIPDTIERREVNGTVHWFIWNETTLGENFAEKWNRHPERARAFFSWHARFRNDVAALSTVRGIDLLGDRLKGLFGQKPANDAIATITERVTAARSTNNLRVAPNVGLTFSSAAAVAAASTPVRSNTFFGS
ncbi:MAG: nucleotidyltransferase [Xanthobacteraceae bacterium]|nr:nucleotidyltransferase [Xanthobacteraceae bacterium]